jgi:hypothetical protein
MAVRKDDTAVHCQLGAAFIGGCMLHLTLTVITSECV